MRQHFFNHHLLQQLLIQSFLLNTAVIGVMAQQVQTPVIQVTGVRLNPTANGINLILETTGDLSSPVSTSSYENTITAEISNSQLSLPQCQIFHQNNLSPEITALTINQTVNNKIQVVVTGKSAVPTL